ncbi:hypothetical protein evm_010511 [Chilo suppressalis]|nr:hypothetical protein evm_010511 [Chilo suppressalis]
MFGTSSSSEIVFGHIISHLFSSIALSSGVIVYALLMNITPRLFAMRLRATLFGCCHAVGQLGTMISYLVFAFLPLNNMIYVAVNMAVTMALATLTFTLVDVDGRELPDLIEDMDYFSELSKPIRWATQKTNSPSHEEVQIRIYSFGSGSAPDRDSQNSQSHQRTPARQIGFVKFWRRVTERLQRMFRTNK